LTLPSLAPGDQVLAAGDGSELYVFDSQGRHLRTVSALTGVIHYQFGYDGAGRLTTITEVTGGQNLVTTVERDGGGNPTGIVSPYGQRTTLTTDANGYLASISNPAGEAVGLSTSADGLLQSLTDPRGGLHRFQYETDTGRLTRDEDAAGLVTTLSRTEAATGHTISTTRGGQTTSHTVERLSTGVLRLTTTFPDGTHSIVDRGTDGVTTATFADGTSLVTTLGPDPRWGMLTPLPARQSLTTPGGRSEVTTLARTVTLASPNDLFSVRRLVNTVTSDGKTGTSTYAFDPTQPESGANQRTITSTSPAGRASTTVIDGHGRITQQTLAGLEPVTVGYTGQGRLSTLTAGTDPTQRQVTVGYGAANPDAAYVASITGPLSSAGSFSYNAAGRLVQEVLAGGRTVAYAYDADGNLTSLTPPGRDPHTIAYGADGQMTSYTPPAVNGIATTSTTYTYDGSRRLTRIARPDGLLLDFGYDASGRPTTVTEAGGTTTVTYDPATGDVATITGPDGLQVAYVYDGVLRTGETWSNPIVGAVTRTFDTALRVATRSVNGSSIALQYDQDSLLTTAGALTLTRHPQNGLVTGTALGSLTDARTYTSFGELDQYAAAFNGTPLYGLHDTRDALGRIVGRQETIGGSTDQYAYAYDSAGRLTTVQKNGATTQAYTYDANGNRLSAGPPASQVTAVFDGQDRLTQSGSTTYAYTANGDLQTRTAGGQVTTYAYDAEGSLLHVALPAGGPIDYLVDGLGRRVGKSINSVRTTGWLYDERGRLAAELDGANSVTSRFVYASRSNTPDYLVRGADTYRIVSDTLGSPRLVVRVSDGTIMQRTDYDAWGAVVNETLQPAFAAIPFGFAGGLYDRDTRLVHFRARDYDPELGRWTAKDPVRFAGGDPNLYAYASNDPINRLDASGLDDGPADGGVCSPWKPTPLPRVPIPKDPLPALCPTCPTPAEKAQNDQYKPKPIGPTRDPAPSSGGNGGGSSGDSGGSGLLDALKNLLNWGPFKLKPDPATPSLDDVLNKDPKDWFKPEGNLTGELTVDPDFRPTKSPGDPAGPKLGGPQCQRVPQSDPGYQSCTD
jgi:RHS repeat-associated protein